MDATCCSWHFTRPCPQTSCCLGPRLHVPHVSSIGEPTSWFHRHFCVSKFWFPSSGERRLGCMVMSGTGYLKFGCCWVVFWENSCAIGNCLIWFSLSQQRSLYCTIDVSIKSKTSEGSYLLSFSSWMSSSWSLASGLWKFNVWHKVQAPYQTNVSWVCLWVLWMSVTC